MTPETITIPASITIPQEKFDEFVNRLGYQEKVEDPNDNTQMIDNTESKIDFAQRKFKEDVAMPWLLQFSVKDIEKAISEKAAKDIQTQKREAYEELSPAVTIG